MLPKDHRKWLCQEEARIRKHQHQHRGLNFQKLLLPPDNDRKVNLVGRDNHIYKGSIRRVPEDQLPPEIDEKSIDEEALYKEIRDMNFPPVPEQEPLGPSRRIEGEYTLAKRMALVPVHVDCTRGLEEILVSGKDGSIYRGKGKYPSKLELDMKLRGSETPVQKVLRASSTQGYVKPSLVLLSTSDEPLLHRKDKRTLIELPAAGIGTIISMVKESIKQESERITDTSNQSETTELGEEDLQSEDDKASEKSQEITDTEESTEAENFSDKRREGGNSGEDTEETSSRESTGKVFDESDAEADDATIGTKEEPDTEASEETGTVESSEPDETSNTGETEEDAGETGADDDETTEEDAGETGEDAEEAEEDVEESN